MDQATVGSLRTGETYDLFLLVRSAEERTGKNGTQYLDMNLCDRTGEINCKKWDNTPAPAAGTVIKIRGRLEEYNGRPQMRVMMMREPAQEDAVDLSQLIPCAPLPPEEMRGQIDAVIGGFASDDLKKLVREMLRMAGDPLDYYPAAKRLHHAERSGLLHHTVSMLRTADHILQAYPFLRGDVLRAGVILHDLAKITEMKSDTLGNVTDYTRDGLLVGHLVRGVANLNLAAERVGVHGEIVLLLEHMIISHHGEPEFGSPKLPAFAEAEALHWIDLLDARMNEIEGIMERTPAGAFSEPIWSLDNRRLYHPFYDEQNAE